MAKIYNGSQIRPTDTNQDVGGFIRITCILDEGAVTVNDPETILSNAGVLNAGNVFSLAARMKKYDPITLKIDDACTYEATEGRPVVTKPVTSSGLHGYILTEPKAMTALTQLTSSGNADTLAKRLAGRYYRFAQVVLFCSLAEAKKIDNSAILVGSSLKYDISDDDYELDSGGNLFLISAHKGGTAGDYVLGLFGLNTVVSQA